MNRRRLANDGFQRIQVCVRKDIWVVEILKYNQLNHILSTMQALSSYCKASELTVMSKVFEGGDGCISGGRLDRSIERFDFRRFAAGNDKTGRDSVAMFKCCHRFRWRLSLFFYVLFNKDHN